MAKDLGDFVAGNRRNLRRSTTRFVESAEDKQNGIYYGRTPVYTSVSTRLVGDSMGARRSGAVTVGGHELIAASAVDQGSNPAAIVYGDGTSEATRFDTALGNQLGSLSIASESTSGGLYEDPGDIILTSASTTSVSFASSAFEVGVEAADGTLLTREVYDAATVDTDLTFETTITLDPSAAGQGVVTDSGTKALTDAVIGSKKVFRFFPFSDQDDALDTSLTSLPNETFRTTAKNDLSGAEVVIVGRVTTADTPSSGFPYTIEQAGIVNDTDDLFFASSNRPITVNADTTFTAQATVVIRN